MEVCAITIFPHFFDQFLETSLVYRAITRHLFRFSTLNPRDFGPPPHYHIDDVPYGGGAGMVMRPEPLTAAIEHAKQLLPDALVIAPTASGTRFRQADARELSERSRLVFL